MLVVGVLLMFGVLALLSNVANRALERATLGATTGESSSKSTER